MKHSTAYDPGMNGGLPRSDSHAALDYPQHPGARWIVGGWFIVTLVLAVFIATSYDSQGENRLEAVLYGACGASTLMVLILAGYGGICREIWKRTRGYPFRIGDLLLVTRGPWAGKQGRVVSFDQGAVHFKIELHDHPGPMQRWFQVQELRKLTNTLPPAHL